MISLQNSSDEIPYKKAIAQCILRSFRSSLMERSYFDNSWSQLYFWSNFSYGWLFTEGFSVNSSLGPSSFTLGVTPLGVRPNIGCRCNTHVTVRGSRCNTCYSHWCKCNTPVTVRQCSCNTPVTASGCKCNACYWQCCESAGVVVTCYSQCVRVQHPRYSRWV